MHFSHAFASNFHLHFFDKKNNVYFLIIDLWKLSLEIVNSKINENRLDWKLAEFIFKKLWLLEKNSKLGTLFFLKTQ
jgi:hypothetical protein